jgi:hypothetical protein
VSFLEAGVRGHQVYLAKWMWHKIGNISINKYSDENMSMPTPHFFHWAPCIQFRSGTINDCSNLALTPFLCSSFH